MPKPRTEADRLRKKLHRKMVRTCTRYRLLEPDDRILVAVSGGKDSYTMLDLLAGARRRSPFPFELLAVHLDQGQPGYDGAPLADWLADFGIPFEIVRRDTYSVVRQVTPEGGTYCAACSRLRRGVLYSVAAARGCNKLALGHHRADTLETFLMNLFYTGRLQAMPPRYRTNDGRFEVIRPLIECPEAEIAEHARQAAYPILPCTLCGRQPRLKRDAMSRLLEQLEQDHPRLRSVMLAALQNVRPTHLLDEALGGDPALR